MPSYELTEHRTDLMHDDRVTQSIERRLRKSIDHGFFKGGDRAARLLGKTDDPRTLDEVTYGRQVFHTPGTNPSPSFANGTALKSLLRDASLRAAQNREFDSADVVRGREFVAQQTQSKVSDRSVDRLSRLHPPNTIEHLARFGIDPIAGDDPFGTSLRTYLRGVIRDAV